MPVRFACYSDTHGTAPGPLPGNAAAILHAGDFYDGRILRYAAGRQASEEGLEELRRVTDLAWLEQDAIPVYAVKGNHDVADPLKIFSRVRDVGGSVVEIAPKLLLAGIGWSGELFFDLPTESDLENICESLRRRLARQRSPGDRLLLLTHYPGRFPGLYGSVGKRHEFGHAAIERLVREIKPLLVVQGHIHEDFGTHGVLECAGARCLIVNPGPRGAVVTVDLEHDIAKLERE